MKRTISFIMMALIVTMITSCQKPSPLKQITNYYNEYAKKFDKAKDANEAEDLTVGALEDFKTIIMNNKAYFIDFLIKNCHDDPSTTEANPEVKELQEAWQKCNLIMGEKTNGKWEYMPDFLAIFELIGDEIPKEALDPKMPRTTPFDYGVSTDDECDDECEHDHHHEHSDSTATK